MTSILFCGLFLTILMPAESPDNKVEDLHPLQWEYRIILLFPEAGSVESLVGELVMHEAEIEERDIAWFLFSTDGVKTNYPKPLAESFSVDISRRYDPRAGGTSILLIGKDGGIKGRYASLDFTAVFARIDSMPMRQAEMRRR